MNVSVKRQGEWLSISAAGEGVPIPRYLPKTTKAADLFAFAEAARERAAQQAVMGDIYEIAAHQLAEQEIKA